MSEMTVKLQLFFDYCEIRKSKNSCRYYVNLFMMSRNQKEQNLGR
jgi:hypothetical protein